MPINPDALGDDATDEKDASAATKPAPKQRGRRRTKAELISDAVVPGDDDVVEIKMTQNGSKVERPWLVAVELVREGKAEWIDKGHKYSLLKMDQAKDGGGAKGDDDPGDQSDLATLRVGESGNRLAPDEAALGDEIIVDGEKKYVGHGNALVNARPSKDDEPVPSESRWSCSDGEWVKADVKKEQARERAAEDDFHDPAGGKPEPAPDAKEIKSEKVELPGQAEQVSTLVWRVSGGFLEKIGLPDYSSLQIGPTSVQHHVVDDGRRVEVEMGGRTLTLPAAVIEGLQQCFQISEYVMRAERQAAINFLEAVKPGSTKPQS